MLILRKLFEAAIALWATRDVRLSHLPFMGTPWIFFALFIAYFYMTKAGPQWMASRDPFEIKPLIILHNSIQIVLNGLLTTKLWQFSVSDKFSFACQPIMWDNSADSIYLAHFSYWFFLLKLLDWFDTLFFVLRKKNSHLSFLHIYHHSLMALGVFVQAQFAPAGQTFLLGAINSLVHTVMYTYYLVAILRPQVRTNVTIKKAITQMQMTQFVIIIVHAVYGIYNQCDYPLVIELIIVLQNTFMLCLFGDFYYKNYVRIRKATISDANKIQ